MNQKFFPIALILVLIFFGLIMLSIIFGLGDQSNDKEAYINCINGEDENIPFHLRYNAKFSASEELLDLCKTLYLDK